MFGMLSAVLAEETTMPSIMISALGTEGRLSFHLCLFLSLSTVHTTVVA